MARIVDHACASAAANRWCMPGRSAPSTSMIVVAVALEQRPHLRRVLAGQDRREPEIFARFMCQDRQHSAVALGIEEGDPFPGAFERTRLGLAVADNRQSDEVGVVHDAPERVHEHVAELAALGESEPGVVTDTWLGMPPARRTAGRAV